MSKKISKTIMSLIVFVVFFGIVGITKVHAKRSTCIYGNGDEAKFAIQINNLGGLTDWGLYDEVPDANSTFYEHWIGFGEYKTKNSDTLDLRNWGGIYEGFSGSHYYVNNNQKCPPKLYYNERMTKHMIIFGDGTKNYENNVESALNAEDFDNSSAGSAVSNFLQYTVCYYFCGDGEDTQTHILYYFDLINQIDEEEPDPIKEEIIDDGTEREWVNPTVKTIEPLDEDDIKYSCGNGMLTGIPSRIPKFGRFLYNFLQFLVPIALVLLGTIDLVKSLSGGKEDDIKKNQMVFVKRLIGAVLIFFSFAIIKLILSIVSENSAPIIQCTDCILRNSSNCKVEN